MDKYDKEYKERKLAEKLVAQALESRNAQYSALPKYMAEELVGEVLQLRFMRENTYRDVIGKDYDQYIQVPTLPDKPYGVEYTKDDYKKHVEKLDAFWGIRAEEKAAVSGQMGRIAGLMTIAIKYLCEVGKRDDNYDVEVANLDPYEYFGSYYEAYEVNY